MLRLVLPIFLLASLIAGDAFVPGQQYVYEYVGKIATSIPGVQKQYSGLALNYKVVVQAKTDHLVVQFKDVKVDKVNRQVYTLDHHEFQYRPHAEYAEHLTKPFKVYYEDGMVKKFFVQRDEPEWSINIKKAILTTFQVNLRQYNPMHIRKGNYLVKPDPSANYFRVMEEGIGGECETIYNVKSSPDVESPYHNKVLNVTKTKNYENCKDRPVSVYSNFMGSKCIECGPEVTKHKPVKTYGQTYYDLRGDRYQFVIEKAYTDSETVFTPFTTNGESIITYVNHTLALRQVERTSQIISTTSDLVGVYTLIYKFPNKIQFRDVVDLKKPHSIYASQGHEVETSVVGTLFESLVKSYKDINVHENLKNNQTAKYYELVKQFSTLSYDKINRLYNQYADYHYKTATEDQKARLRLFANVLADVGTNPAYMFVKNLIQTKRMIPSEASNYFSKLSFVVKEATETLLDDIFRFCSHYEVTQQKSVQRACYLAFATLVNEHCVRKRQGEQRSLSYERACTPEITEKYVNYLQQKYDQSYTPNEKVVYLAALGSLGSQKVISILKPIIHGETKDKLHIRQEAIWTLYNMAPRYPQEVHSVASPVLFNSTDDHEMRIAAFTVMIATKPSLAQMYSIVKTMRYDRNYHVQNYIYTTLQYLSNSTHPCHVHTAENAKMAFEVLKASNFTPVYSPKYSFRYTSSGYNPKYNYGGYSTLSVIGNNVSYIPRAVHMRVNDYIGGLSTEPLEVGYRAQGIDKVVDLIFGPYGVLAKKSSTWDILSRKPRSIDNIKKELREIKEALSESPRAYESIVANFYVMRYGHVLNVFNVDETDFNDILTRQDISIPDFFAILKQGIQYHRQMYTLAIDSVYQLPTALGLPVVLDIHVPTQTSINIKNIKLQVTPSPFSSDRSSAPTEIKLIGEGRITTDQVQVVSLSVMSPFDKIKYGAGYEHRSIVNIPLKGHVRYDVPNARLAAQYEPIFEEVYHSHFEPFTYIDSYANEVSLQGEKSYNPIGIHKFQQEVNKTVGHEYLGLGFNATTKYHGFHFDQASYAVFLKEHDWRSALYYYWTNPTFTPYNFTVNMTQSSFRKTHKIDATFNFKYHDVTDQQTYNPVHAAQDQEFETYTRSQSSRKPQTLSVVAEIKTTGDVERKINTEVVYQWSFDKLLHRYALYAKRSPFVQEESETSYCLNAKIRYPQKEWQKLLDLKVTEVQPVVKTKLSLQWGRDCNSDKKVVVESSEERTEEQMEYLRQVPELRSHYDSQSYPYYNSYPHPAPYKYNPYADLYYRCQHQKSNGHFMNNECLEYIQKATELRKIKTTIKYENIPEYFSNATMKLYGLYNYMVYPHVDYYFNPTGFNRPQGQIEIKANMSVHYPIYDAEIKMPYANVHYEKVYDPYFYPVSSVYQYSVDSGYFQHYFSNYKHLTHSVCTFDKYVTTFTNSTYVAPYTDCFHVLAKDCSEEQLYTVLLAKSTVDPAQKNLRVLLKKHTIEILPYRGAVKVRVDGKAVPVTTSTPYFQEITVGSTKHLDFVIRVVDGVYFVDAPYTGVYVHFDGKNGAVFLSNYYRGKQCGLCGNMNGRNDHTQFSGPENCFYTNTTAFTLSYAIPTSQCTVPRFHRSTVCDVNPIRTTFPEEVCTPMRNRIVYGEDFDQQVCFSTKPIPECNRRCKPTRMLSKNVEFHCLSTRDSYAQRLIGLRERRVLYELNNKQGDKRAEIQYPESCVSEYQS